MAWNRSAAKANTQRNRASRGARRLPLFVLAPALCILACDGPAEVGTGTGGAGGPGGTSGSTASGSAGAGGTGGSGGTGSGASGGGGAMGSCDNPAPGVMSSGSLSTPAHTLLEAGTSMAAGSAGPVAVAFIAVEPMQTTIGATFSTDGGATFGAVQYLPLPGMTTHASDPAVAVDSASNYH